MTETPLHSSPPSLPPAGLVGIANWEGEQEIFKGKRQNWGTWLLFY